MLLRIIFPVSIWNKMKEFLEENAIVIVAESAIIKSEAEEGETAPAVAPVHSLLRDDADAEGEREREGFMREKSMFLDIKVDPELFRKVEEAVATMARGAHTDHCCALEWRHITDGIVTTQGHINAQP